MKIVKRFNFGFADVFIYDNDVFHFHYLSKVSLQLGQIIMVNEVKNDFIKQKKVCVLYSSEDEYVTPTKETIQYIQSAEWYSNIKANAWVIKSFSHRLALKAALVVKKTKAPVAYFKSKEKAINWLLTFCED